MLYYFCFSLLFLFEACKWTLFSAGIFGRCVSKRKVSLICMCVVVMSYVGVIVMAYVLLSLLEKVSVRKHSLLSHYTLK
jgi:hypothetical protein